MSVRSTEIEARQVMDLVDQIRTARYKLGQLLEASQEPMYAEWVYDACNNPERARAAHAKNRGVE